MTMNRTLRLVRGGTDIVDDELPGYDDDGSTGRLLDVIPIPDSGLTMVIVAHLVPTIAGTAASSGQRAISAPDDVDGLLIDRTARCVWVDDAEIRLTFQEYELLAFLTARPAELFSRGELIEELWTTETKATTRTVDVHMHRLRRKLGPYGRRMVTVRRMGYSYRPPEHRPAQG